MRSTERKHNSIRKFYWNFSDAGARRKSFTAVEWENQSIKFAIFRT